MRKIIVLICFLFCAVNSFAVEKSRTFGNYTVYFDTEDVTIVFEHPIDDTEEWRKNFCKTVPKDYGYHYKDIEHNMKVEDDCVRLHLKIGRF